MTDVIPTDQEMMARVLKGQEHLTVAQQLRNVCESFSIVQADNVRLYALADQQDDEIERLKAREKLLLDSHTGSGCEPTCKVCIEKGYT